ncbi:MAG: M20/M25/M40 family metallo-hydrolase, partial [Myxococcota bacterium]|nr:M20/M25/M40 family metallo-hydrolase [Myxococcota bacterium]
MIWLWVACSEQKPIEETGETVEVPPVESIFTNAQQHLEELERIAMENDGNRFVGTSGYDHSVSYVKERLEEADYVVDIHRFELRQFVVVSEPELLQNSESVTSDIGVFEYSPSGSGEGKIIPVDLQIPPGSTNSSTSGCQASDYADFETGGVALLQRGSCTFSEKAERAQDAGAAMVLIFNEGQNGRRSTLEGTLGENTDLNIPVLGLSYEMGVYLNERAGESIQFSVETAFDMTESYNIFAERQVGDPNRVMMIGAHLDSVQEGPGINDNGSGVAGILAMAEQFSAESFESSNRIRFAFWGAEEIGLVGSYKYIQEQSEENRSKILMYLNFDMIASPNYVNFIYDGDGSQGPRGPRGSDNIEDVFKDAFRDNDLSYEETPFDGRSDYGPFIAVGIPAGGLFSGAEAIKSPQEEESFGGRSGESYDECYHRECDSLENI